MKSRCSSYTCLRLDTEVLKLCPFFKNSCASRESVTIFHSFQVINMICFMFWLIFCYREEIGGIFITMNDSSLFFDIQTNFSKQLFAIYNKLFELFWNGWWVFQNSLNPGASGGQRLPGPLNKALPWAHVGLADPWPPASFSGFQLWTTFTPAYCIVHVCQSV